MSVRPLSLQEWFICHQLRHIDRHHFHLDAQLAADLSGLQQAYGEAMLELRARKKLASLLGNEDEK